MNYQEKLIGKLNRKSAVIGIIGLGYVGLPLVIRFIEEGFRVLGIDIDDAKVKKLNAGKSYIEHIPTQAIRRCVKAGFHATTNFAEARKADALIICVPTPLDEHREPDLSYVIGTVESLIPNIRAGQIMSLESTTYPGTTDEELLPRIQRRGFTMGKDYFLVFSPEREDPGNKSFNTRTIPKVCGGDTPACRAVGESLYSQVIDRVVPVGSTRVAEMTKLLENIHRSVNIGLVNEMKIVADSMGIDIHEVIAAASTKPFGFVPYQPGPGLGGHCIPIDPFYLTWKAREYGQNTRFIELAGEVNTAMPEFVVNRVAEALNHHRKPVNGSRVLLLGLAYKPNVDDDRESPSYVLMSLLKQRGAEVSYYDPYVPVIKPTREHPQFAGIPSVAWDKATIQSFDLVLIATNHAAVNYGELAGWAPLIVDTRNAMAGLPTHPGQVWQA